MDSRVQELLEWVAQQDRPLPMPIAEILELEDAGCMVDLETGQVQLATIDAIFPGATVNGASKPTPDQGGELR